VEASFTPGAADYSAPWVIELFGPARGKHSVTIVGPETTICDALSTAVFIHPKPEEFLREYPEYGAVIVDEKGKYCLLGKTYGDAFVQ